MSSTADDRVDREALRSNRSDAGFALVEAMVALIIAGLFLAALGRVFASAWSVTPRPQETLTSVALARAVVAGAGMSFTGSGEAGTYRFRRSTGPIGFIERPSGLAPAPPAPTVQQTSPPPAQNSAILRGLTPPPSAPASPSPDTLQANPILAGLTPLGKDPAHASTLPLRPLRLRRLTVVVETPSRRRLVWQAIGADDAGR
ncbi:MAG TPA: prepilin-type N-terminal cleavage/methylation domain-containing protein [Lichenihabitans sp.]|jgi:hypothetical protein|nr:prepilin-type N-terminal cleavage/methylation domain-containing protein [Lichenihabitans sp.]